MEIGRFKGNRKRKSINQCLLFLGLDPGILYVRGNNPKSLRMGTIYNKLTLEEIEHYANQSRKRMLVAFHPDRFKDEEDKKHYEKAYKRVGEAHSNVMHILKYR